MRSLLIWSIASLFSVAPAWAQTSLDPDLQIESFVSGLSRPLAMDWLAPNDILVAEYATARVRRVLQDGSPAPGNPFTLYCSTTTTTTCSNDEECPGGETCLTQVAEYWAHGVRNCFGMKIDPVTLFDMPGGASPGPVRRCRPFRL